MAPGLPCIHPRRHHLRHRRPLPGHPKVAGQWRVQQMTLALLGAVQKQPYLASLPQPQHCLPPCPVLLRRTLRTHRRHQLPHWLPAALLAMHRQCHQHRTWMWHPNQARRRWNSAAADAAVLLPVQQDPGRRLMAAAAPPPRPVMRCQPAGAVDDSRLLVAATSRAMHVHMVWTVPFPTCAGQYRACLHVCCMPSARGVQTFAVVQVML